MGANLHMDEDIRVLFHELAGLPTAVREDRYARRHVPAPVRAELESLLTFDETRSDSMAVMVGAAAEHFLLSNAPVSEGGR